MATVMIIGKQGQVLQPEENDASPSKLSIYISQGHWALH